MYDQSGELVCTKPFPCMPIYFWNDPQGLKYKKAYFNKFAGERLKRYELVTARITYNMVS